MTINKVTITGADDKTDINKLVELQNEFPFVEWGILFSTTKIGTERYPSREWVKNIPDTLNLSAHFCGWYAKQVLEHQDFGLLDLLPPNCKRVQLNYNFKHSTEWNLDKLYEYGIEHPVDIIFQYNKSNKKILDKFMDVYPILNDFHFLYDSSGGNGIVTKQFEPSFKHYTGYSGGFSVDNIENNLSILANMESSFDLKVTPTWFSTIWVDLETGARTDNQFDFDKVGKILEISSKFVNK